MQNINTAWFRAKLEDRQMSQRTLARIVGIDSSAMSLMLRGRRRMTVEEAGKIAQVLGVAAEEVLRNAGAELSATRGAGTVKVAGWIDENGQVNDGRPLGPVVVESPPGLMASDCVALRIQSGDQLDGWLLYYRPGNVVSLEVLGQMCIVELADGRRLLRSVQRGYEPGFYTLSGWASGGRENVRLVSASPVLWMRQ